MNVLDEKKKKNFILRHIMHCSYCQFLLFYSSSELFIDHCGRKLLVKNNVTWQDLKAGYTLTNQQISIMHK